MSEQNRRHFAATPARALATVAIALAAFTSAALAQTGPMQIVRSVIASGATFRATNATTILFGTAGQTVIGPITNDFVEIYQGFWAPAFSASAVPNDQAASGRGTFKLANSPNPFESSTDITFQIPDRGHVELKVFDMAGVEVARLVDGMLEAGEHRSAWDGLTSTGERAPAGMYTCLLTVTGSDRQSTMPARRDHLKMMLVR